MPALEYEAPAEAYFEGNNFGGIAGKAFTVVGIFPEQYKDRGLPYSEIEFSEPSEIEKSSISNWTNTLVEMEFSAEAQGKIIADLDRLGRRQGLLASIWFIAETAGGVRTKTPGEE